MLAGCGATPLAPATADWNASPNSLSQHKTFFFTGEAQSFTVPAGVHSITVIARGAGGANICRDTGRGGRVSAVIPVTPHGRLTVYVGGQSRGGSDGFNGGGHPGGGGASDIRVSPNRPQDRLLVAGGGGADGGGNQTSSDCGYGLGGGGGDLIGGNGVGGNGYSRYSGGVGGSGGTQRTGGAGGSGGRGSGSTCQKPGNPGSDGNRGVGGAGGNLVSSYFGGGGGGGGGYFGGGGGGSGCGSNYVLNGGGGGGGGSSYAEPSARQVRMWRNWKNATTDGVVVFSWQ